MVALNRIQPRQWAGNIVFILADDLGWGELGCYGQKMISTPNLDRLASQGVRFTQHYSGAPVCAPSRCVLMTGKHLGHAEVRGNMQAKVHFPEFSEGQIPLTMVERLMSKAGSPIALLGERQNENYQFGANPLRPFRPTLPGGE